MQVEVHRGEAPLIVSFPHTGTEIPAALEGRLVSPWLARKDADWWIHLLYDFAAGLGATTVRTPISRTVIDVNRDPSGATLYPGQATTGLCPFETFDGEALYESGEQPTEVEIIGRREAYFDPFHATLTAEIERLRDRHERIVLYEAHSIRSCIPRLFQGELPNFNLGVNGGASCDAALVIAVERACVRHPRFTQITDGRFKGGWITRRYGRPTTGVHAIQMELACRGYMDDPSGPLDEASWPTPYDPARAGPLRTALIEVLQACLAFAEAE